MCKSPWIKRYPINSRSGILNEGASFFAVDGQIKISPEVRVSGNESTFEALSLFLVRRVSSRASLGVRNTSERSYSFPSTFSFIFLKGTSRKVRDVLLTIENVARAIVYLAAARPASALNDLAKLNELLDVLAALNCLECVLAAHESRLGARVVAAAAHTLDEAGTLDALLEPADKVYRGFAVVFLDFCVNSHVAE